MRQVSVQQLFDDNRERLGLHWLGGRQGGNRFMAGDTSLKPTVGQVGHMNLIHPFRIQLMGAAENSDGNLAAIGDEQFLSGFDSGARFSSRWF